MEDCNRVVVGRAENVTVVDDTQACVVEGSSVMAMTTHSNAVETRGVGCCRDLMLARVCII